MARKKSGRARQVGFRMPEDRYELLTRVAEARGVDVTAVINQALADAEPGLEDWLRRQRGRQTAAGLLASWEEKLGPANVGAVREVLRRVGPFAFTPGMSPEELARLLGEHDRAILAAAEKVVAKARGAVTLSAAEVAYYAEQARAKAAWDALFVLSGPQKEG